MKTLLLFLFCFAFCCCHAQTNVQDSVIQKTLDSRSYSVNVLVSPGKTNRFIWDKTGTDSSVRIIPAVPFTKAGKIPCIKPDTKNIAPIPNGWKGKTGSPYVSNPPRIRTPSATQPWSYSFDNGSWEKITPHKK